MGLYLQWKRRVDMVLSLETAAPQELKWPHADEW